MTAQGNLRRLLLALGVLILGVLAGWGLELSYLPVNVFSEISVSLRLPEATDPGTQTRRWVVPLEAGIRAAGGVRSLVGTVDAAGAELRVRLEKGVDTRRKAARIESELSLLRSRLPPAATLEIRPQVGAPGAAALVVFLPGATDDELYRLQERLERLPAVRRVRTAGGSLFELWVRPHDTESTGWIEAALAKAFYGRSLGHWRRDGRSVRLRAAPAVEDKSLGDLPVPVPGGMLPLSQLADLEWRAQEPHLLIRLGGRSGRALVIDRDDSVSPLEASRVVRHFLAAFRGEEFLVLLDEAEPLGSLLWRLLLSLVATSILYAAVVWRLFGRASALSAALLFPSAAAGAVLALYIGGLGLDVTTVPSLGVAVAAAAMAHAWRQIYGRQINGKQTGDRQRGDAATKAPRPLLEVDRIITLVVAAALLPITASLTGGEMASLLAAPLSGFLLATVGAVLGGSLALAWTPHANRSWAMARYSLRNAGTALLATVTGCYLAFSLFGSALIPVSASLEPPLSDLTVDVDFDRATTLSLASQRIAAIEAHLSSLAEVAESWSVYDRYGGQVRARVVKKARGLADLFRLARRVEFELSTFPASIGVVPLGGRGGDRPITFRDRLESEAETDEEATFVRLLLRSTELEPLLRARQQVLDRIGQLGVGSPYTEWGAPETRLELLQRQGAAPQLASAALASARRRLQPPRSDPIPGHRRVAYRIVAPEGPQELDELLPREVLGDPLLSGTSLLSLFELEEVDVPAQLRREGGRFVLPLVVSLRRDREDLRRKLAQSLRALALPPGVGLELPALSAWAWKRERLELLGIGASLPLLLLTLALVRTSSVVTSAITLVPPATALAVVTPFLYWQKGAADELVWVALAATLCLGTAASLQWGDRLRRRLAEVTNAGRLYPSSAELPVPLAVAALGVCCLLASATLGADGERLAWVLPLRASALAGVALLAAQAFLMPALWTLVIDGRRRRTRAFRSRSRPSVWEGEGELPLTARRLTKIYGNGHCALRAASFELEPGIIGLLGPNGAGKTTLLRLLCGLLEPTRGQVLFRGVPVRPENLPAYRRRVGFLPQELNAYEGWSSRQFLDYWALERGLTSKHGRGSEVDRVLALVDLSDVAERPVRLLSGGMRRRIGIARALLGDPPILIVDEPTTGLDVESRTKLRQSLLAVARRRIVLFSTHIASDIAAAAHRILVLDEGRILFDGGSSALIDRACGRVFEVVVDDDELAEMTHRYLAAARVRTMEGVRLRIVLAPGEEIPGGREVNPSLEEAYLCLMRQSPAARRQATRKSSLLALR